MRHGWISLFGAGVSILISATSLADDVQSSSDLTRQRLNRVISVLRLQPKAASRSCLEALEEVHTVEDQIKLLQKRTRDPDQALAQDVLETDYENGSEICGADASRVCGSSVSVTGLSAACAAIH